MLFNFDILLLLVNLSINSTFFNKLCIFVLILFTFLMFKDTSTLLVISNVFKFLFTVSI